MKIKSVKTWKASDIQLMCIRNEFCTRMNNEEFDDMLKGVSMVRPTKQNIFSLAVMIVNTSDLDKYNQTWEQNVESVMFEINEATHTFYQLENERERNGGKHEYI